MINKNVLLINQVFLFVFLNSLYMFSQVAVSRRWKSSSKQTFWAFYSCWNSFFETLYRFNHFHAITKKKRVM